MAPLKYLGLVATILALWVVGVSAMAADEALTVQGNLTFTITNGGITGGSDVSNGGLYVVTVKNDTRQARGVVIKGIDLCCSPYTRYTRVLSPGREVTFRWYFPANRDVQIRDLIRCKPMARTCSAPLVGKLSKSVKFS